MVTGHSMGAGVAALLALRLRSRFPGLKCVAVAAPGGRGCGGGGGGLIGGGWVGNRWVGAG